MNTIMKTCLCLIKREYYEMRNNIFWFTLLAIIMLFFIALLTSTTSLNQTETVSTALPFIHYSTGIFIASFAFWEFKNSTDTRVYLLLPASILEKVATKIIVYILGFTCLLIFSWFIANFFVILISTILGLHSKLNAVNIVFISGLKSLLIALPTNLLTLSIVIFASCYLKRLVLLKLTVFYVLIILPLYKIITSQSINFIEALTRSQSNFVLHDLSWLIPITQIIAIGMVWFLIWLRLKETEV